MASLEKHPWRSVTKLITNWNHWFTNKMQHKRLQLIIQRKNHRLNVSMRLFIKKVRKFHKKVTEIPKIYTDIFFDSACGKPRARLFLYFFGCQWFQISHCFYISYFYPWEHGENIQMKAKFISFINESLFSIRGANQSIYHKMFCEGSKTFVHFYKRKSVIVPEAVVRRCSGALKNFKNFTEKHLCLSLF